MVIEQVPENWDVKVVDYWDAILKSYNVRNIQVFRFKQIRAFFPVQNCHEAPETYDTAEKVADSIMEQFPL